MIICGKNSPFLSKNYLSWPFDVSQWMKCVSQRTTLIFTLIWRGHWEFCSEGTQTNIMWSNPMYIINREIKILKQFVFVANSIMEQNRNQFMLYFIFRKKNDLLLFIQVINTTLVKSYQYYICYIWNIFTMNNEQKYFRHLIGNELTFALKKRYEKLRITHRWKKGSSIDE